MKEDSRFTRKNFLELMLYAGITGVASTMGVKFVDSERTRHSSYPYPEWMALPGGRQPIFFNTHDGHESYLTALVTKRKVLRVALVESLQRRYYHPPARPPLLGDHLDEHVEIAGQVFKKEGYRPSRSDRLRAAVLTFAASSLFNPTKVKDIAGIEFPTDPRQSDELQAQVIIETSPRVFPVKSPPNVSHNDWLMRYIGVDRFMHAAQHMAITSELSHLYQDRVRDEDLMPIEVELVYRRYKPRKDRVQAFSELVGRGWEARESLLAPPWSVAFGANGGVPTGAFDRFMTLDYAANRLGSEVGAESAGSDISESHYARIINRLNDPRITEVIEDAIYPHAPVVQGNAGFENLRK